MGISVSFPPETRDTRLSINNVPTGAVKTEWRLKETYSKAFHIVTGTESLDKLDIWLPPLHNYDLKTRYYVGGAWTNWSTSYNFDTRGPLNSYENYLALSGISGVVDIKRD